MRYDDDFDDFWERCLSRMNYMDNHIDGEVTLITLIIAIAYEAAILIKPNNKKGKTK